MLNNFLKQFNLDKSDFYFIIILFICLYLYFKSNNKKVELFDITSVTPDVKNAISALYQADVEAIRNLSSLANSLTVSGSLTVPGGLNILGSLNTNNNFTVDMSGNITSNGLISLSNSDITTSLTLGKDGWIRTLNNKNNDTGVNDVNYNAGIAAKNLWCNKGTLYSNHIDLGSGDSGREGNAGKIEYGTFDGNSLCIVGKGTSGGNRLTTMWDNVNITNTLGVGAKINVGKDGITIGDWTIDQHDGDINGLRIIHNPTGKYNVFKPDRRKAYLWSSDGW